MNTVTILTKAFPLSSNLIASGRQISSFIKIAHSNCLKVAGNNLLAEAIAKRFREHEKCPLTRFTNTTLMQPSKNFSICEVSQRISIRAEKEILENYQITFMAASSGYSICIQICDGDNFPLFNPSTFSRMGKPHSSDRIGNSNIPWTNLANCLWIGIVSFFLRNEEIVLSDDVHRLLPSANININTRAAKHRSSHLQLFSVSLKRNRPENRFPAARKTPENASRWDFNSHGNRLPFAVWL